MLHHGERQENHDAEVAEKAGDLSVVFYEARNEHHETCGKQGQKYCGGELGVKKDRCLYECGHLGIAYLFRCGRAEVHHENISSDGKNDHAEKC